MRPDAAPLPDDVALCHQIIRELQREVAELKVRLNQNSSNSSKPPSSNPPSVKRAPPKRPTGKKRGGQPGHKPHRRDLVSPEKVAASFNIKPEVCRGCGAVLLGDDPEPLRHQVAELPPIEELREYVRKQDAGADETSWRENRSKAWFWVAVTQVATVFTIAGTRGAKVIREMLGEN